MTPQDEYRQLLRKWGYGVTEGKTLPSNAPPITPKNCIREGPRDTPSEVWSDNIPDNVKVGDTITVKGERRKVLKVTSRYLDCCDEQRIRYYRLVWKQHT